MIKYTVMYNVNQVNMESRKIKQFARCQTVSKWGVEVQIQARLALKSTLLTSMVQK